ncbi:MAG TPA: response regulator [Candidatus Binatia bacterium]|nr:response regulator [Candidatus Binatia bacterium]
MCKRRVHDSESRPPSRGVRRRVLLAEDDAPLRGLIAEVLRADGHEVLEARDGVELLAQIEAALVRRWQRADAFVIVADVHMPGFSGLDVLSMLRVARCATPVILITGFGDDETREEARELGVVAVLDKPFPLDALRAAVQEIPA